MDDPRKDGTDAVLSHEVLPQRAPKRRRRDGGAAPSVGAPVPPAALTPMTTVNADADADVRLGFEDGDAAVVRYAPEYDGEHVSADDARAARALSATTTEEEEAAIRRRRGVQYEYKDHTADIQIHAWGVNLAETFAWSALAMFDYMTPLEDCAREPTSRYRAIHASGHDLDTLLFAFLDELLFAFHTEMFIVTSVQVCEFSKEKWEIRAVVGGTTFVEGVTRQGTEIKAITYSAMKIIEHSEREIQDGGVHGAELFVIVDI